MKNLFTKIVFIALMCGYSLLATAQCPTLDDVNFPSDIVFSEEGLSFDNVFELFTPEELVSTYGFSVEEAYATWADPDVCGNLQSTYEDNAFDNGDGSFKILRNWIVIDWNTGNTVEEYQVIRNIVDLGSYCLSEITVSASPWNCTASFTLGSLLYSGFEYENLNSSPAEFTNLEIGVTEVTITGTVSGEEFECVTTIQVVDNTAPIAIASQDIIVQLDPTTCFLELTPEMIDNGSHDGNCGGVTMEVSPSTLTQADAGSEVIVTLTVTDEVGNVNFTWSTVTVEECGTNGGLVCIAISTAAPLNDSGLQLYAEDFLVSGAPSGSDLSLTIEDSNGNIIPDAYIPQGSYGSFTYTVIDNQTGNSCWGTLSIPLPYDPCTFLSCYDSVITVLSENGEVILSPSDFAIDVNDCPDLLINISDMDGNLLISGTQVIITEEGSYLYSVFDSNGNSCWGILEVGEYVPCPTSLNCNDEIFVSMSTQNGGPAIATITSDMILEGNISACPIDDYIIELVNNEGSGNNFAGVGSVVVDEAGTYTYTISSPVSSCWGIINIENLSNCPGINDVTFPADIDIALTELTDDNLYEFLTPQNLQSVLGFSENQTVPTWPNSFACENMFFTYDDTVIVLGNGSYKIIRTWTVLDWLTGEVVTNTQIIHNITFPGLICDFLPNNTAFGDCESGHTMDDDVEWPADLLDLEDYRIKPGDLELYSMVDPSNSQPVFVNNENLYAVDYVDILNELQFNEITVFRIWTVSNGGTVIANYSQTLVIDITNFANLVSVNTMFERPIPDVMLNDVDNRTNQNGIGFFDEDTELTPTKENELLNGITIKDKILAYQHITGFSNLTNYQMMAGDLNLDQTVSAIDLVAYTRLLLEIPSAYDTDWFFIENTENIEEAIMPKANYIGIKRGDIDDDASLGDTRSYETGVMTLNDVLINNGESYETRLQYDGEDLSLGVEIHLYYDPNLIQVEELYIESDNMDFSYNIEIPGEIHATLHRSNLSGFLFAGENLINIKFNATSNGLLSQAIKEEATRNSYLLGLDNELVLLSVEMGDVISTGIENTADQTNIFKVYPNPATDIVNFEFIDQTPSNFTIQLFDTTGKLVSEYKNDSTINVSSIHSGMYIYRLVQRDKAYGGHISIIK